MLRQTHGIQHQDRRRAEEARTLGVLPLGNQRNIDSHTDQNGDTNKATARTAEQHQRGHGWLGPNAQGTQNLEGQLFHLVHRTLKKHKGHHEELYARK